MKVPSRDALSLHATPCGVAPQLPSNTIGLIAASATYGRAFKVTGLAGTSPLDMPAIRASLRRVSRGVLSAMTPFGLAPTPTDALLRMKMPGSSTDKLVVAVIAMSAVCPDELAIA